MEKAKGRLGLEKMNLLPLIEGKPFCQSAVDSTPISQVLENMASCHYSSIPVQNSRGKYIGITNIMDVILFVMGFVADNLSSSSLMTEIDADAGNRLNWEISSCLGLSEESKSLWSFSFDSPLPKLLEAFHKGVHRALVLGPEWGKARVISQGDILSFLLKNLEQFEELSSTPFFPEPQVKEVFTVLDDAQTFHAFTQMAVHGVRGIPVVDRPGQLIASLDAGDIKGLKPNDMSKLLHPLRAFFEETNKPFTPPVTCKMDIKIGEILSLFVKCGTHTIWVVNENMRPINTITPSDVIAKFASF